jgi:hypothetical protein
MQQVAASGPLDRPSLLFGIKQQFHLLVRILPIQLGRDML